MEKDKQACTTAVTLEDLSEEEREDLSGEEREEEGEGGERGGADREREEGVPTRYQHILI